MSDGSVTVDNAGGGAQHENMPPFLAINFIIAITGIYPPRHDSPSLRIDERGRPSLAPAFFVPLLQYPISMLSM
jgi:hypothetical protein